jgi:NDP-sugar pyrophosphorylase family protein
MIDMKQYESFKERESLPTRDNVRIVQLAGGKGSRLGASDVPKPLREISLEGYTFPMMDLLPYTLPSNFKKITVITSSDPDAKAEQIEQHITCKLNIDPKGNIDIYREKVSEGTAGALFSFVDETNPKEDMLVLTPSDTVFPFGKMNEIVNKFDPNGPKICWVLTSNPEEGAQNKGKIIVNGDLVTKSLESQPDSQQQKGGMTSVGVIIFKKDYFRERYKTYREEHLDQTKVDMYRDFIPWLLQKGEKVGFFDIKQPASDLGTRERLSKVT